MLAFNLGLTDAVAQVWTKLIVWTIPHLPLDLGEVIREV